MGNENAPSGPSAAGPRLLITGSRNWTDRDVIDDALWDWLIDNGYTSKAKSTKPLPVLVSGACETGADAIAEELWRGLGYPVERHPADWKKYGYSAGPRRNSEMVQSRVAACLAFPKGESRGTRGCIRLARQAGVPVTVYEAADVEGRYRPIVVPQEAAA